jgi:NDP-sugar pyrophosphorylase family protein
MVEVGGRPVLWHMMKILGHYGISEFIVCTGYKSEYIKNYFKNYGAANVCYFLFEPGTGIRLEQHSVRTGGGR